ncbi:ABC transporter substrate-binding protein [Nakamurella leprariae]|uniref:ABC transporter substrate-binding protein n=1 Tax=Nakamurella leprariae TaxID=2803911 RepID=A0A938YF51_9ACTN|nr:ABC transporter substrate-binding protein [Nakamurella leprariae]MBM9466700.1 ABC transporter substrate-binding protein [Nakamurella leprariae]
MRRTRALFTLVTAAALALAAGCGGSTSPSDSLPAAAASGTAAETAGDPQTGGSITVGVQPPCGLDKAQTSGCNFIANAVVDNLTEQVPATGEIVPWLATSWEISEDQQSYTFHLQDGVTFSNGEVLDATAVKTFFDDVIELGKQGKAFQSSAYLLGYQGSEVVDPLTITVSFDRPKAGLLQALSEKPLGIVAPETIRTKTPDERLAEGVIGSGPFVIEEVVPNQRVVLTKRADYEWSSPKNAHVGPAYLDRVTFQFLPENSVRTGSLTSGEIQVESAVPATDVDLLKGQGFEIAARASAGIPYYYAVNLRDPILSQEPVRQALQVALDRPEIVDTVFTEYQAPATGILSRTHPNYVDLSDELAYAPDRAAQLLDEAGWTEGADGIRQRDGRPLTITVQSSSSGDQPLHELVQQQLRRIGIDLQIQQLTQAQISENRAAGNWQLLYSNLTRPDGDVLVSYFDPDFSTYLTESYDPELEQLLSEQTSELDVAQRQELLAQIQQIVIERGYGIPVNESSQTLAFAPEVHGVDFEAPWWPTFVDTWIEQ